MLRMYGWTNATERAYKGKRGQRILRELEAMLLAMPRKRLIDSRICENGDMCVIGVYLANRGADMKKIEAETNGFIPGSIDDTARIAEEYGMAKTLAWDLAYTNDEALFAWSPEDRWTRMLRYIRSRMIPEAVPA